MSKFKSFIATTFIGGVVVILPIAIFFLLANWIVGLISGFLEPIVSLFPAQWNTALIKLSAFGIIIALCFMIGLVVRTQFGNNIFSWVEETWLSKLPLYSTIKETVKQFIGNEKTPFSQVVMVRPFGDKSKMIGFVTDELDDEKYVVFVPTAPNPTNGYVFVMGKEDIEFLDTRSEEAMKTIISLGAGTNKIINRENK
ncbi:MAG: DUF502 domain-containing protein [Chitinophagales bacterium]